MLTNCVPLLTNYVPDPLQTEAAGKRYAGETEHPALLNPDGFYDIIIQLKNHISDI